MLRSHKTLSIFMTLCLCLALVAPLVIVSPALAGSANTVAASQTVTPGTGRDMGVVKVVIPNAELPLAINSQLTVSFPSEVFANGATARNQVSPNAILVTDQTVQYQNATDISVMIPVQSAFDATVPSINATAVTNSKFTLTISHYNLGSTQDGIFYIYFSNLDTSQYAGDFTVNLIAEPGSVFSTTPGLVVGTVKSGGSTSSFCKSVYNITSRGGGINTITIFENSSGSLPLPNNVELKILTKGFSWNTGPFDLLDGAANNWGPTLYDWGWATSAAVDARLASIVTPTADTVGLGLIAPAAGAKGGPGQLHISGLALTVDDTVARVGSDVEVKISAPGVAGFTEQTFVVAKYVDFEATVKEGTTTELISGKDEQKLGEFYIEELAPDTLVANRTISFTLPEGYAWDTQNGLFGNNNYEVVNSSNIVLTLVGYSDEVDNASCRTLKMQVTTPSVNAANGAKIKFKNLEVLASPAAKGDLSIEVSGNAGAQGTVKVATCTPMITLEATPVDVALGIQSQKVSDVTLKEAKAGALIDSKTVAGQNNIVLQLDEDFAFTKIPTVTVESGDIVLQTNAITIGGDRDNGGILTIPIKAGSLKTPAAIKVSDVYVTANRNAPEGPVLIKTAKARRNAFNNTGIFADYRVATATIANNKTVPPAENVGATTGEFNIGSNVYKLNGMTKVMDAAPYIKNNRTYIPVRYLGYALGLTDADIVWDDASQKATLTKGSTVVELTIGSTTITVNGEAKTIEVAPELNGNRTMLPARFVAEAFGAKVGWNAPTQGVVIEN